MLLCPTAPHPAPHPPPQTAGLGTRLHSAPCLLECASGGGRQKIRKQHSDPVVAPSAGLMTVRPLHSSPRLSELMQRSPLPTILGSPSRVSQMCLLEIEGCANVFLKIDTQKKLVDFFFCICPQTIPPFEFPKPPSSPNLVTFLTQQGLVIGSPGSRTAHTEPRDLGQHTPTQVTQPAHCIHRLNNENKGFGRLEDSWCHCSEFALFTALMLHILQKLRRQEFIRIVFDCILFHCVFKCCFNVAAKQV